MKKILMGTTAIFAAGAAVAGGVAQAQEEPISVGVGGYYRAAIGFVDQDDAGGDLTAAAEPGFPQHSTSMGQDIELKVSGSTTLDNGMTVGVNFALEGNAADNASSTLDERFLFFRGNFGQIRVGSTESARQELVNFAPSGAWNFGVNTPFFKFWGPNAFGAPVDDLITTYNDNLGNEDALRILYFTPVFNGFRAAISYAPDDTDFGQYGGAPDNTINGLQDHLGIGAEYNGDFGDFSVRLSGGYESYVLENCGFTSSGGTIPTGSPLGSTGNCEDNPSSWNAGATVSFGGFSIGGGYIEHEEIQKGNTGTSKAGQTLDYTAFDVGISYWTGPWGVGIQYGSAESEQPTGFETEIDQVAINGTYILGPGIDVEAQIDFGEHDLNNGAANSSNDWVSLLLGTAISF